MVIEYYLINSALYSISMPVCRKLPLELSPVHHGEMMWKHLDKLSVHLVWYMALTAALHA